MTEKERMILTRFICLPDMSAHLKVSDFFHDLSPVSVLLEYRKFAVRNKIKSIFVTENMDDFLFI